MEDGKMEDGKMEDGKMEVQIRGLRKSYGGILLYDDFSFDIEAGKVTAITGPSGCGKTTLLRLLAGLEPFDDGTFQWWHGAFRKTAFVFQEDRLMPWLTVRENLKLVLGNEMEREEAVQAVEDMLSFMNLSEFVDYYPEKLSGGMQRRVAVGRALLYDGDILLMDEPFKGLDVMLKQHIMESLCEEWKRKKRTVVIVTHDFEDAKIMADRLWEFSGEPVEKRLVFQRAETDS